MSQQTSLPHVTSPTRISRSTSNSRRVVGQPRLRLDIKPKDLTQKVADIYNEEYNYFKQLLSSYPEHIQLKVKDKSLTKEDLNDLSLTDILRLASTDKHVEQLVYEELGYAPLPLKEKYSLEPHQLRILLWMVERSRIDHYGIRGGIINCGMGLGKTLMALAFILITRPVREESEPIFPALVVASKTVMQEWKREGFEKFFGPGVKVLYLHKDFLKSGIDNVNRSMILKYDVVITTYDTCRSALNDEYLDQICELGAENTRFRGKVMAINQRDRYFADLPKVTGKEVIFGTPWRVVVADESQVFANPTTILYKAMMAIYGDVKWCLTGTPIRNKETDIWSQLRWVGYKEIKNANEWKRNAYHYYKTHNLAESVYSMDYEEAGVVIPNKIEKDLTLTFNDKEQECYDYILKIARKAYDLLMSKMVTYSCVLAIFLRLRQCCIAPFLITPLAKRKKDKETRKTFNSREIELLNMAKTFQGSLGEWVLNSEGGAGIESTKMKALTKILYNIPEGEKVLVYSSFTSCLDLAVRAIKDPNYRYLMIDGDVVGHERAYRIKQFEEDPGIKALFLTYKVGSEGLNLTRANHVIPIEPWWTPAVLRQAAARCWRRGQEKEVIIHNIFIKNSIEDRVMEICREKDEIATHFLNGTKNKKSAGISIYTMGRILGKI